MIFPISYSMPLSLLLIHALYLASAEEGRGVFRWYISLTSVISQCQSGCQQSCGEPSISAPKNRWVPQKKPQFWILRSMANQCNFGTHGLGSSQNGQKQKTNFKSDSGSLPRYVFQMAFWVTFWDKAQAKQSLLNCDPRLASHRDSSDATRH